MSIIERLITDTRFRIKLFLSISFCFNILYSVFLLAVSFVYSSKWFFVMSVYYGLLFVARIFVFVQIKPQKETRLEIKTMRSCGYFLLLINVTVATMMFVLMRSSNAKYNQIVVIALATYTFCSLTTAIINSVKYLKRKRYVYSSAKLISLTSASISMVTLTNTMLATFGEENELLRIIILPILCSVVCAFIIVSAVLMIRKADIDIRKLKNGKERK